GADAITFSGLFSSAQTITLTAGGQLELTDAAPTTITGPGSGLLTVSGNGASRVFQVDSGAAVALSALTMPGARAASGGGLRISGGTLPMTNCTVSGNSASEAAGLDNYGGTLTMTDATVSGNSASDHGGGLTNSGTLTLTNVTVSGNSAT